MINYLNNPLVYLFKEIETQTGYSMATFVTNETTENSKHRQSYMQQFTDNNTADKNTYKYLYDPGLSFDFRFHQRLAKIKYTDRKSPWITIMFNTREKSPWTNVISHKFNHHEVTLDNFYKVNVRRNTIPIDMVFISNDMAYLYAFIGKLNFWFDRGVGFHYNQSIEYASSKVENYELAGEAFNIKHKNLSKLDTERRGSLVSAGFEFDLIYWELGLPEQGHLAKNINVEIRIVNDISKLNISIEG